MLIFPAIDLREGVCVRLLQGRFDDVTQYGDPIAQVRRFAETGAEWVHVVDLDGARVGAPRQYNLIGRLARETGLKVQCGGGVRTRRDVEMLLDGGAARVVIGTIAARNPESIRDWIAAFGVERVCVALDVRAMGDGWEVAANGWASGVGRTLDDVLAAYPSGALKHVLVTDIARDGALQGPNVALMRAIHATRPDLALQASGGVASLADLRALLETGAAAVIIGRALYEARFALEDALAL